MANEENLNPCKPGETHNPNGRPKGSRNTKTIIKEWLSKEITDKDPITKELKKMSLWDFAVAKQIKKMIDKGDTAAFREILDRLEGKPQQKIKQTINDKRENIEIEFIGKNKDENKDT